MSGEVTVEYAPKYSRLIGLIFVFNLIVGTGALTMPKAFYEAGYILSGIVIVILAFMSYMTATFVTEALSISNALDKKRRYDETKPSLRHADLTESSGLIESLQTLRVRNEPVMINDEATPLIFGEVRRSSDSASIRSTSSLDSRAFPGNENFFEISEKFELGTMASMYFGRIGVILFYISICIYLYGDLAVYAAGVPKSIRDVACVYSPVSPTLNDSELETKMDVDTNSSKSDSLPCWYGSSINRMDAYRLFLTGFTVVMGPFVFFNVSKTKLLQVFTSAMRWFAFIVMLVLALIRLISGKGEGHPEAAIITATPNLFGICVYAFMCHHSLPSLVTPIQKKQRLNLFLLIDYIIILSFYLSLSYTAIFSFRNVEDLYTLNFQPHPSPEDGTPITNILFFEYYLALFPVFTLSTNFPIIAITLRNNLDTLFCRIKPDIHWAIRRIGFPFLALLPPIFIAYFTNDMSLLVGVTGSYAGTAIQYLIPAFLVFYARKVCRAHFPVDARYDRRFVQMHRSPFHHNAWLAVVLIWAVISVSLVTVNHFVQRK